MPNLLVFKLQWSTEKKVEMLVCCFFYTWTSICHFAMSGIRHAFTESKVAPIRTVMSSVGLHENCKGNPKLAVRILLSSLNDSINFIYCV